MNHGKKDSRVGEKPLRFEGGSLSPALYGRKDEKRRDRAARA